MRSIRATFVVWGIAGATAILLAVSLATYWVVAWSLQRQFDDALVQELNMLQSLIEIELDGQLIFDDDDLRMTDFSEEADLAFLEIVTADGRTVFRSEGASGPGLVDGVETLTQEPRLLWLDAPLARVRAVAARNLPRLEEPDEDDEEANLAAQQSSLQPVTVVLARRDRFRGPLLTRLRGSALGVLLAAIVLMGLLMSSVGAHAARRLEDLAQRIDRLPVEGHARVLDESTVPEEAKPIVRRLNALLERVRTAVERERALSADVAHELRTPLAGLRSLVEVGLHRERNTDDYRTVLRDVLGVIGQTERMVERLLVLHGLEESSRAVELVDVDLGALLKEQWSLFATSAQQKELRLVEEVNGVVVRTDRTLLRMMVANLLDNAVSHSPRGARVRLSTGVVADQAQFVVGNSGSGIAAGRVSSLFQRFTRGDEGRGRTGMHVGLGLPLVRRVGRVLGAEVRVKSELGGDFEVEVRMPR